jgi:hypothetical protein
MHLLTESLLGCGIGMHCLHGIVGHPASKKQGCCVPLLRVQHCRPGMRRGLTRAWDDARGPGRRYAVVGGGQVERATKKSTAATAAVYGALSQHLSIQSLLLLPSSSSS